MLHDLEYAWRSLRHRRAATFTAVLCLALGIGANTALFGVVDALLFRPQRGRLPGSTRWRCSARSDGQL